jgi:uncharacterized protein (TIGR03437 family)
MILPYVLALCFASSVHSAPFGAVVEIGGHASDLAIDERRSVVYVSNFTANRIEVISTADLSLKSPLWVPAQPASLALSSDGRYLVVAHYTGSGTPFSANNGITIIDLDANSRRTLASGAPPLAVAFGADGRAVIVTTSAVLLLDPASGATATLASVSDLTAEKLPVAYPKFPPEIVKASANSSADRRHIYAIAGLGSDDQILYVYYDVAAQRITTIGYTTSPKLGPRVVSVADDGSFAALGWGVVNQRGILLAQFNNALGKFDLGTHAIDSRRGLMYAQIPEAVKTTPAPATPGTAPPAQPPIEAPAGPPFLMVVDADNLAVRERLWLPENLVGKALLSSDGAYLYAVSESGLTVLPVGSISRAPRVVATREDLLFRGNYCDRRGQSQEIEIVDPGGGNTPFTLVSKSPGVSVSPESGTTPAKVKVMVDPSAFQNAKGTSEVQIEVQSSRAVNLPPPIRVLLNNREPDQRGSFFNVPGKLVDVLADPVRDRYYVLRQDANQVLVFDGASYEQIATLRTGNTPWQMAITLDGKNLITTADNSQIAHVYDLDTLKQTQSIEFPGGHYPRSIAVSGNNILVACRVAGPKHTIDAVDIQNRRATELPSLGIYENKINENTALAASPSAGTILVAQPDGNVLIYSASAGTFTAARKDLKELSGAAGAPSDDRFIVDSYVLNRSLVVMNRLDTGVGLSSGVAGVDGVGIRTAAVSPAAPGVIERVELRAGLGYRPVRISEAPPVVAATVAQRAGRSFVRSLAPLANRRGIVSLSTSGFTVLAWEYDASVALPVIEKVVNAADESPKVAPGALIKVLGNGLSPANASNAELPLSGLLGEACLTVNGIPVPMARITPTEIVGQLPFSIVGQSVMVLKGPGGVSNQYAFDVLPQAPSVFLSSVSGTKDRFATIVRGANADLVTFSNPIHPEDRIAIFLTGMGRTVPDVAAGYPGPSDPLSQAVVQPEITLGGVGLPLDFAGLTPGQVGVYQINARVPWWVPTGMDVPLVIRQGGETTTIPVRVVK